MMKHQNLLALLLTMFSVITVSCSNDDEDEDLMGKWYRVSDFDGLARGEATSFTIGNKGYLTGGYDARKHLNDLWEYDMELDFWTQKASFPGTSRSSSTAFSVGGKGYFGTGYDGKNYYNDFWEYNPSTNAWSSKKDYPGSARNDAIAFGLSDKGYLGSGYDGNYLKDFYCYDPQTDTWEQIVSLGGSKRRGAACFVINDIAYVCSGFNNGEYVKDFWKYDPSQKRWIQLRDITDTSDATYDNKYNSITRIYGVAFVIDGQAYLTCGGAPDLRSNTWKYSPTNDLWEEVAKLLQAEAIITALTTYGNFIHTNMTMTIMKIINIKIRTCILWISLLSLLTIILLHHSIMVIEDEGEPKAELEIFQYENGWGYQIVMKQKVLIYQPTIPAIDTAIPFPDEVSTRKVGILVLKRFNAHRNFSVSKQEVLQCLPSY